MKGFVVRVLAVGATVAACVSSSFAADLSRPPLAAAMAQPSWVGFYLGIHGGYGWSDVGGFSTDGFFGGGQGGYNWQSGNIVYGVEADGAWASLSDTVNGVSFGIPVSAKFTFDNLVSARGRVGFVAGNGLYYVTGGGGWAHAEVTGTALGVALSQTAWHSGWTLGAGAEWMLWDHWSAKVEYIHYFLGSATYFGATTQDVDIDTVKVGLNYRF